jgi:uncharacterized membrane protein YtjA (UPF0391 family)
MQLFKGDIPLQKIMLRWSFTFLFLAMISAILGFVGIAGNVSTFAQITFLGFLVLFLISFSLQPK